MKKLSFEARGAQVGNSAGHCAFLSWNHTKRYRLKPVGHKSAILRDAVPSYIGTIRKNYRSRRVGHKSAILRGNAPSYIGTV